MTKPNALVVESGNLLENEGVLKWLKEQQEQYHLTILIGAGEQTNQAFRRAGYEIKFCPMGRVTDNLEQKQLCLLVGERNRAIALACLKKNRIKAEVMIPFDTSDKVITPLNGDVAMFSKYLGYYKIFRLTTADRVEAKKALIWNVALAFAPLAKENGVDMDLAKIEVVGF